MFLNYSCNAKCPFCFNPADPPEHEWKGMSITAAVGAMTGARGQGCDGISFIGGEPTVRPDFLKIVAAARRLGFSSLQLVTNGVRLSETGYASRAVKAGLNWVDVSIHAADAALHDRQLGLPGAYEKAVKAVGLLQAAGVPVGVNCVISAMNYKVLPDVAREFSRRGVRRFSFFGLRYIGHAALPGNLALLRVSAAETVPYVRKALAVLKKAGCLESTFVNEYTPCQLPEYVDRLADWERGANCDEHSDPDGRTAASEEVCSEGKMLLSACGKCVYKDRCLGVERMYLGQFGEAEFKPVLA